MAELTIGIVASGPEAMLANLKDYKQAVNFWIGADRGNLRLLALNLDIDYAVGDFDSVSKVERAEIKRRAKRFAQLPREKDETDLELAIEKALSLAPKEVILFGVTGGRKDHELINIQLLYRFLKAGIRARIIDEQNELELTNAGTYQVERNPAFPYVSLIPFTEKVEGISLEGFRYLLNDADLTWGSTLCISNELSLEVGTISYRRGILLVVKSRDAFAQ